MPNATDPVFQPLAIDPATGNATDPVFQPLNIDPATTLDDIAEIIANNNQAVTDALTQIQADVSGMASEVETVKDNQAVILAAINLIPTEYQDISHLATSAEVLDIPVQVEQAFIDETDGNRVIEAFVNAIGNENIVQAVLVAALRDELERTGGLLDLTAKTADSRFDNLNAPISGISSGGSGGLDETSLHSALDSYANKESYMQSVNDIADQVWNNTVRTVTENTVGSVSLSNTDILQIVQSIWAELLVTGTDNVSAKELLTQVYGRLRLDKDNPLTVNEDGSMQFGGTSISATTSGVTPNRSTTLQRDS